MMTKTRIFLAAAATVIGIGSAASADDLQFAHFLPEAFPPNKAEMAFVEAFQEATGGEINIELAFGGVLGGQKEMLDYVANNVVAMASFPANHYIAQLPAHEGFSMSQTYETPEQVAALFKKALQTLPLTRASYEKANVTPFLIRGLDSYMLLCNTPVRKVADLKGLKIRTYGSAVPIVFETLGAVPINMLTSESYEAMQRGTVDCVYFSRVAHLVFKIYEVAKYNIDFDFGATSSYLSYINNDVYNGWTDAQRDAFWAASEKGEAVAIKVLNGMTDKAREVFEAKMETMTIEDGHLIREQFDTRWMLNHYVETIGALGPDQAAVAKEIEGFLIKELGL